MKYSRVTRDQTIRVSRVDTFPKDRTSSAKAGVSRRALRQMLFRVLRAIVAVIGISLPAGAAAKANTTEPVSPSADATVEQRVLAVRERLSQSDPSLKQDGAIDGQTHQWGNWPNWPNWAKWNNWGNWPNWGNWGNWFNG
jgi:hypothetical protein